MKRFILGFFLVTLATTFAFSQTTGRLAGTISGPDGVLPGATVTATDSKTGKSQTTISAGDGSYLFPQLEFGEYTVKVTASGFKAYVANAVKIDVGRDYSLSPTLEIGAVEETVTVTAGADVVTSGTAQVSNTVSPQQILALPLITRNPLSLTALQAGVSANSANLTTINGMRTTFTNITRDGINIQDTFIRSNATDFAPGRPSVDDTGEFTISTTNQEADQGYGGAQIRLVTPRGTKDFHGALFAYNRNSEFAANSFFNNRQGLAKPFRNRNQFGGKISGPMPVPGFGEGTPVIFKNKGFFFFAYEGIRDPVTAAATRTILTPAARAGTFTYTRTNDTAVTPFCPSQTIGSTCTIPNFLTWAQGVFPAGNIRSTISPIIQSAVLNAMPTASNFTGGDGRNTAGYRFLRGSKSTRDQYSSRFDVDINDRNTISGIYNYNKENNQRPDVDTAGFDVNPVVDQGSVNKQITLSYRRVFTPKFINEFRGGAFTSVVPFDRFDALPSYILSVPLVTSPLQFLDQGRNTKAFNLQSNADWVIGKHSLRFGGQAQIFRVNAYNDAAILPVIGVAQGTLTNFTTANFTSVGGIDTTQLGTANGMLALLGGQYTSVTQAFNLATIQEGFKRGATEYRPFRYENHALYVADRWSVARGLTLNLGVRYELFPALRNNTGNALEPKLDINNPISSILDPNGVYQPIGGNAGRKNAYYRTDYNNFGPNLGVSWSPDFKGGVGGFLFGESKTVIRAGYSQVFGNDSIVTSINNAAVGNAGLGRTTLSQTGLNGRIDTTPPPEIALPSAPTFPRSYLVNNGPGIGNFFGTVFAVDPKIQTPMVEQYSFGVQREIFGNMAFEIRYVGSRSNNLGRGVDIGQVDIINNGFLADFLRAKNNLAVGGSAFCVSAGCVPLTIFQNGGVGSPGRLAVGGATGLSLTTFNNNLTNGTPADLAAAFVNSTNPINLNNQPCIGTSGSFVCNPAAVPFLKIVPNPASGVLDLFNNDGRYRYDSLQAEIRKRLSNGLYFQVNYTYSKNMTNAIGTSQALFEPFLDNGRKQIDYQRADFDTTHVFNFNGIYQLPFGKGQKFLNYGGWLSKIFIGGWELSGLGNWQSGAPITFVDTRGTFNRSARSGRQTVNSTLNNQGIQNLVGIFEQNGRIYWINPSIINASGQASAGYGAAAFTGQVFSNVEPGQVGNIGRALIDGPSYFNINMALLKNIRFTESMRLQFRVESFNLLNNVNFVQNTQFANINSTSFGQISSAFGPREIQFAARFEF